MQAEPTTEASGAPTPRNRGRVLVLWRSRRRAGPGLRGRAGQPPAVRAAAGLPCIE
jgi:hypothetical protein